MRVDAYLLNPSACQPFPNATLAPLAQPNYTFLRLDSALMEPDVLPTHDLHNASPAAANHRITDLATGRTRVERCGVYLHWMLPRTYRSGTQQATGDASKTTKTPKFRAAPDRWLVVRRLRPGSFQPADAVSSGRMKWLEAWVVESNRVRNITEFGPDVDIELECAPFVVGDASANLDAQAEIFIGAKKRLDDFTEQRPAQSAAFVPLNVAGAANPMFADFTPHNSNVFSVLDNFTYRENGEVRYLKQAAADYYVLGWHSLPDEDGLRNLSGSKLADAFASGLLELKNGEDPFNFSSSRAVCHGAVYGAQFNSSGMAGISVPAHDAARKLADPQSHPVTVGTTPLDAVLAYIRSHAGTATEAEEDILHLETLLLKQEDDLDGQAEALDMLTANNFQPAQSSGSHWTFAGARAAETPGDAAQPGKTKTFQPTDQQQQDLQRLNAAQTAADCLARELKAARGDLFARWWKFCSDGSLAARRGIDVLRAETATQAALVGSLSAKAKSLSQLIDQNLRPRLVDGGGKTLVQQGSQPPFYKQSDPTVLVPGVKNPWPVDWLKPLRVRLDSPSDAGIKDLPGTLPGGWDNLRDLVDRQVSSKLPGDIQPAAKRLLSEFFNLQNDRASDNPPLYHDHVLTTGELAPGVAADGAGRDQWNNTQPYFPLFLEYEIRYYHLDWRHWTFGIPDIDPPPGEPHPVRYGIRRDQNVKGKTQDERVITGRILVLPQPGFALSTDIQRLFQATLPADLPADLRSEAAQEALLTQVQGLPYLSAPLSGFSDHLVTLLNGMHIKPSVRLRPDAPVRPLQAAVNAGLRAGFDDGVIRLMDIETTKTPYSDYVFFPDDTIDPLKPVSHGQFKFTRLDIFDKWGQAISAINPAPSNTIPPLYPALSEYFHPQHLSSDPGRANTVGDDPYDHCQFAQFPPTINQDARINASFLHFDADARSWRPCTEWESPIWGFLVVNYAEYALQVFLPDGTFYREVRLGGPSGATETPAWKPFAPPQDANAPGMLNKFPQLDRLLAKLRDKTYLRSFISAINASLASVPHTPNQYAEFLNAVVGRPLALANAGFSLELAAPPLASQSTASAYPAPPRPKLLDYRFPVKLGDRDRVYDGLVGYFPPRPDAVASGRPPGDELDLASMLTYFHSPSSAAATTRIARANYPVLAPYHLSTGGLDTGAAGDTPRAGAAAAAFDRLHTAQLQMAGLLLDPFSPVHLYSGILPVKALRLPSWSLQAAMRRMTAFFRMGPLLVTDGAALRYVADKRLTADYNLAAMQEVEAPEEAAGDATAVKHPGVAIPAMRSAEWNWLAPFAVKAGDGAATQQAGAGKETQWNPFVISHLDNRPKFEKGPYMAVEGYLQLKHPITAPDTS